MHILMPTGNKLHLKKDSLNTSRRMGFLHFICHFDLIEICVIIEMLKVLVDFARNVIKIEKFKLLLAIFSRL